MAEEKKIATGYIGNALRSTAADHITTFADEVFDTERQKYQNEVNADLETTNNEIKADLEAETARATAAEEAIIYDVSAHNDGAVFESLQALLNSPNLSTLIPTSVRHGGMSIRFIQGSEQSSDNKYVQCRLTKGSWSINVDDWAFSASSINSFLEESDLDIADKEGNVIVKFEGGHIKTKNFDSSKPDVTTSNNLLCEQDLVVSDEEGNTIVEFEGGHIKTKNFDSSKISPYPDVTTSNNLLGEQDLVVSDEEGNTIVEFEGGHIKTKNFDSSKPDVTTSNNLPGEQDLVVSDEEGNTIVEFEGGHIKTKNFDSSKIDIPKSNQSNLMFSVLDNWDKCLVNGWSIAGNKITSTAVGMANSVVNPNSYTNLNREIVCDFELTNGIFYCGYMGINIPSSKSLLVSIDSAGNLNLHKKVATMGTISDIIDSDTFAPVSHNHYRISIKNPTRGSVEIRLFDGYTLEELANIIKPFQYPIPSWGLSLAKPYFFSNVAGSIVTKFDVICHFSNDVKLLILGDSITQGYDASAADNCYAALLTSNVANSIAGGWSGGTYDVIMRSLDSEAPYISPKFIMVTIGTNGGSTVETIKAIIDKIININSIPIINHIPMAGDNYAERVKLTNEAIDTAISQYEEPIKCVRFDVATALNYNILQGRDSSLFTDDLHPNDNGHRRMFNQIKIDIPELFNN